MASSSQVRGSVSTTLGGVPRVCLGPAIHCTATNGGTRISTDAPGAAAASVRAVSRTASANSPRPGAGASPSRSHASIANTAARVFAGSAALRADIPNILKRRGSRTRAGLVTDTGASIAPDNHFEIGQSILSEDVWDWQVGEYTMNP